MSPDRITAVALFAAVLVTLALYLWTNERLNEERERLRQWRESADEWEDYGRQWKAYADSLERQIGADMVVRLGVDPRLTETDRDELNRHFDAVTAGLVLDGGESS